MKYLVSFIVIVLFAASCMVNTDGLIFDDVDSGGSAGANP